MRKYLFDSNILIFFHHFTPIAYHTRFWNELRSHIIDGNIVLLSSIVEECKDSDLRDWLEGLGEEIVKVDKDILSRSMEIDREHRVSKISQEGRVHSKADTHLIAYAQKSGHAILTYEKRRRKKRESKKIPDVCDELGIHCERLTEKVLDELKFVGCG